MAKISEYAKLVQKAAIVEAESDLAQGEKEGKKTKPESQDFLV